MKRSYIFIFLITLVVICGILPGCKPKKNAGNGHEFLLTQNRYSGQIDERRITITGNEFSVYGKRIWINGANTPWDKWNDFGGGYNDSWWDKHFAELHEAGINATRVWINCNNGNGAIDIREDGMVMGVSAKHWADLDLFFATAERNKIFIMATLLSFDHFKNEGSRTEAGRWRNMIKSKQASESFVMNYTIPFVQRYRDNPWLWSIDLMNEPDWVFENEECGKIPWENMSYFFALNASAIHEHSHILVTVGMAFPKYNVDGSGYSGNKVSDTFLQRQYSNSNAYLDFWSPHYYDWVGQHYGVPFYVNPYGRRPGGWGLDNSKPALIGEVTAKGTAGKTITDDFENAFQNGWQGVMPWTSNGVDANGGLNDMSPATKLMLEKHRDLIFPWE